MRSASVLSPSYCQTSHRGPLPAGTSSWKAVRNSANLRLDARISRSFIHTSASPNSLACAKSRDRNYGYESKA